MGKKQRWKIALEIDSKFEWHVMLKNCVSQFKELEADVAFNLGMFYRRKKQRPKIESYSVSGHVDRQRPHITVLTFRLETSGRRRGG